MVGVERAGACSLSDSFICCAGVLEPDEWGSLSSRLMGREGVGEVEVRKRVTKGWVLRRWDVSARRSVRRLEDS